MKYFIKSVLLAFCFIFFSCEVCDCDAKRGTIENIYNVSLTPKSDFKINKDTIWIDGIVSSKVLDEATRDSIISKKPIKDLISIYKFVPPTNDYDAVDAIDKVQLIDDLNGFVFLDYCKNGLIQKNSILSPDGLFYKYRLGIVPKELGSYIISFLGNSNIQNENRNAGIAVDYMGNASYHIGFNSCGQLTWKAISEIGGEYYFKVTN